MKRFLTESTKTMLDSSWGDRIEYVWKDKWIEYKAAGNALRQMQRLIDIPPRHRPKNILLVGPSNNGKTMILEQLLKNNPGFYIQGEDHSQIPCLKIQAPFNPGQKILFDKILYALIYPKGAQLEIEVKQKRVFKSLATVKTRILIIDEIHNASCGLPNQQREFLNWIKRLSNELSISIVAAGTSDAFDVINSDPQIAHRFKPINLNRWTYNKEFAQLLYTFEGLLPLKDQSKIFEQAKAQKILSMSEGYIGEIAMILREAFRYCMESGLESISTDVLNEINYASPSLRRKIRDKDL